MNCSYSEWLEIVFEIPKGSTLGPFLIYMFSRSFPYNGWYRYSKLQMKNADENTLYVTADNIDGVSFFTECFKHCV